MSIIRIIDNGIAMKIRTIFQFLKFELFFQKCFHFESYSFYKNFAFITVYGKLSLNPLLHRISPKTQHDFLYGLSHYESLLC